MQNTEETITKYAVDANLFRLGSTDAKKNIQHLDAFQCPYGNLFHAANCLTAKTPTAKNPGARKISETGFPQLK